MAQKNAEQFSFETKEGEAQIGKYIYLYIHINLNGKSYSTNKPNIILHILTSILTLTLASTIVWRHVRRSCETSTTFEKTS